MADDSGSRDPAPVGSGDRWKAGEPLPWAKWFWRDWLASPAVRRLTPEQRGRFVDVWSATHGTKTPGVMTEEDVRCWAGYGPKEWEQVRGVFAQVFNTTRQRGKWRLEDVIETWKASQERSKRYQKRARKAVEIRSRNRSSGNGITTRSGLQVQLEVTPDVRSQKSDLKTTAVPDVQTVGAQTVALARSGTGGTDADAAALLERALSAGCASGTGTASGGAS